jgi:hypothetical protein
MTLYIGTKSNARIIKEMQEINHPALNTNGDGIYNEDIAISQYQACHSLFFADTLNKAMQMALKMDLQDISPITETYFKGFDY